MTSLTAGSMREGFLQSFPTGKLGRNQQERRARDFSSRRGSGNAGVLCVLQAFQTDELAENIRHLPQRIFRASHPKKGALRLLKPNELETLRQMARGLAAQFGSNCEVVVHEISERSTSHSVVAIENGHVSGRKLGDGPSQVVLEQLGKDGRAPEDQLCYLTRTPDGKLLKSSSIYIRDESGRVCAIFCINFDISALAMAEQALAGLTSAHPAGEETPRITHNVNDLLDDLIEQSDRLIGKPVALMSKEDKVRAIHFLNEHGALLVTKSGDKIAKHFGISKYTLYSYLDVKTGGKSND